MKFFQKRCVPRKLCEKGPIDGIDRTIKNLVYRKVLSRDFVIDIPKTFAEFANEISNVDYLFLWKGQLLKEPEDVAKATPIPAILKIYKVKRVKEGNSFVNKFYYLIEDLEFCFTQKYSVQCGHKAADISDDNIYNHYEDEYVAGGEWIQCPICTQWYHEKYFYE